MNWGLVGSQDETGNVRGQRYTMIQNRTTPLPPQEKERQRFLIILYVGLNLRVYLEVRQGN